MLRAYRRELALGLALLASMGIVVACVGDDPKIPLIPNDGVDGGTSSGNVGPQPTPDGALPGTDSGDPNGASCATETTLRKAGGATEECRFGCIGSPSPHCGTIYPSGNAITPGLLTTEGVLPKQFTSAGPTKFDTDTGEIEGTRTANDDPLTMQVKDGIGFKVADIDATHRIGIWVFESVDIAANAAIRFTTANAAAFVVAKTVQINGVIDLRGYNEANELCKPTTFGKEMAGGPGGGAGSIGGKRGSGPGGGYPPNVAATFYIAGTGGAGFGGVGGQGGSRDAGSNTGPGGDGGVSYGEATLNPLLGGSGGAGVSSYSGGGGGGAFHLVAGEKVSMGDGASKSGINAGGCPGVDPQMGSPGGGGGSGGAVLIEAPLVELKTNAGIAANGATGAPGSAGKLENSFTQAFAAGGGYGSPGNGGGAKQTNGNPGFAMLAGGYTGGAGGGAAGRIRIHTRTGNFAPLNTAIISPNLDAPGSPSSVGKLDVR